MLLKIADGHHEVYGEGVPRPRPGQRLSDCLKSLRRWCKRVDSPADLSSHLPETILSAFSGPPAARAALDMALHDLWAFQRRLSVAEALAELYGLQPGSVPLTSYTIGIDTIDKVIQRVREADRYPILKVKLGTDRDLEIVEAVRSVSDAEIRVDANCAWTRDETRAKAERLFQLGVSLIEQPLPVDDLHGYRELFGTLPMPVIADESCRTLQDLERLNGAVEGVNIKLSKVGGLREGARMIRAAREQGMLVMLGCFVESSLGITAAGALGACVDFLDLDGASLLSDDPFEGATIQDGQLVMPPSPGFGARRRFTVV